jgi:hypothetical protein
MPSETDASAKSPYAGLDYRPGEIPSTAALGPLAESIVRMFGIGPMVALPVSVLLDQGKVRAAMDLLHMEAVRIASEREAAQQAAAERRHA